MKNYYSLFVIALLLSAPIIYAKSSVETTVSITNVHKVIYVSNNGTDRNDGLTPDKPKRNIEIAIDAAGNGDIICLAQGVYDRPVSIGKNITLTGTNQVNTIIDVNHTGPCIVVRDCNVTVSNLTIKNGCNGIHISSADLTLENSTITNNTSPNGTSPNGIGGGGIRTWGGSLTIKNSTITNNTSPNGNGGGIWYYGAGGSLIVKDSIITYNIASSSGGICTKSNTVIYNSYITFNTADGNGGGIWNSEFSDMTIYDSFIAFNSAKGNGGGIYNGKTTAIFNSNIRNNTAKNGGGIYNEHICYADDLTMIFKNRVNNTAGNPIIPA